MKLDGIWRGDASYPGKPSCNGAESCCKHHKTDPIRRTRNGKGAKGGRFTESTDDTGPMKPGNRVEDKSLEIRKATFKKNIICRDPAVIERMATDTSDMESILNVSRPGHFLKVVKGMWEVVNERQW